MKHDLPSSVDLTCSLLPGTTWGKWFWEDKGGEMINSPPIPLCAVSLSIEMPGLVSKYFVIRIKFDFTSRINSLCMNSLFVFQEIPTCTTVQQQMDPNIAPFTLDYVTTEQTTFIKIEGERYINRSVPIRSTVNMSCFYDGNFDSKTYSDFHIFKLFVIRFINKCFQCFFISKGR